MSGMDIEFGDPRLPVRFWAKVEIHGDCWVWTAYRNPKGYGRVRHSGRLVLTHRLAYETLAGPIRDDLRLDHVVCQNKACCNPEHLEPVTSGENTRRHFDTKTHCINGHPLSGDNLLRNSKGYRFCRTCANASYRRYRSKRAKANAS